MLLGLFQILPCCLKTMNFQILKEQYGWFFSWSVKCDLTAVLKATCRPESALWKKKERGWLSPAAQLSCLEPGEGEGQAGKEPAGEAQSYICKYHKPLEEQLLDTQPCPNGSTGFFQGLREDSEKMFVTERLLKF